MVISRPDDVPRTAREPRVVAHARVRPPSRSAPGPAPAWNVAAWLAGVAVLLLVAAAEAATGDYVALVPFLVLPPIVTAISGSTRETTAIAAAAVIIGVAIGAWSGELLTQQHLVRLNVVAMVGVFAVYTVTQRARREERLARVSAVAQVAQRAVLHPLPHRIDDVLLATRYRSATKEAGIGGDFYEAVATSHGVRLIVGDVRGKGLDAVRLAAGVLGAFRLVARKQVTLVDVARDLDDYVALDSGDEDFVTALLVEFGRTTTVVSCGHHPPAVLTPGGDVMRPAVKTALPLGLGCFPVSEELALRHGDRLVICTDGVLEGRDRTGMFFPFDEALSVASWEPDVDSVALSLEMQLRRHVRGVLDDDLAIVVAERIARTADPT